MPEKDRIRYTISPQARKEILERLLLLNHQIHEQEVEAGLWEKKKKGKGAKSARVRKTQTQPGQQERLL